MAKKKQPLITAEEREAMHEGMREVMESPAVLAAMRDNFAAHAIAGAAYLNPPATAEVVANRAYAFADAMMVRRMRRT